MNNPKASILPRNDNLDELNAQQKANEEINSLKNEISKLQFIIEKYNLILSEYQKKNGNEIFLELEKQLNNENNPNEILKNNEAISRKKSLIENISLFKEYEAIILDKNKQLEFLKNEITQLQIKEQKLTSENEEIRNDLEKAEKDKNDLYNQILNRKKEIEFNNTNKNLNDENLNEDNVNLGLSDDENQNLKKDKEKLLKAVEEKNEENEYNKNQLKDLQNKYETFIKDKGNSNDYIEKLKEENEYLNKELIQLKNTIETYENDFYKIEKDKNEAESKLENMKIEYNIYKKEIVSYQELYNEMEQRKNNEIYSLQNELTIIKTDLNNLKDKNKINEEKLSNLKFENSQLKNENKTYKSDCDHLIKIIEDSNITVQNATMKENNMNNIIKNFKKQIDDINLEKEKFSIKIKMQDEQIKKLTNDYSSLLREKSNNYDGLVNSNKDKYENLIKEKDDELNELKTQNLTLKMDKDYYLKEYNLIKNQYDKINETFHSENDNYIKQFEQSQKKINTITSNYEDKISQLTIRSDKLESENNILKSELQGYKTTEKNRQNQINKMNQNEIFLQEQIKKLKEEVSYYSKENDNNIKEKDRINALNETKIKNLKDDYEMKIIVLENSINYHKNQLANVEAKAFDMIKKHENFEKKLTNEYNNTLNYYQNLISDLTGENINEDFQYPDQEDY